MFRSNTKKKRQVEITLITFSSWVYERYYLSISQMCLVSCSPKLSLKKINNTFLLERITDKSYLLELKHSIGKGKRKFCHFKNCTYQYFLLSWKLELWNRNYNRKDQYWPPTLNFRTFWSLAWTNVLDILGGWYCI